MSTPDCAEFDRLLAELMAAPDGDRPAIYARVEAAHPDWVPALRELVSFATRVAPPPADLPARPGRFRPGDRLGAFTVIRLVGEGGMGEVYEAEQDLLKRRVALKVIRAGFAGPVARDRFLREQRVLAHLHQTNIVPVYFAGEHGPTQFCAMQFVDGAPVHRVVTELLARETRSGGSSPTPPIREVVASIARTPAAGRPGNQETGPAAAVPAPPPVPGAARLALDPGYFRSVARLMAQVADAVQHGHDHGVTHRDLKPSNLLIDREDRCWVIDYGLAGYLGPPPAADPGATAPGGDTPAPLTAGPLGTARYMAPEQFDGKTDARSDVWGLGATLYELLTLRPAFPGKAWDDTRRLVDRADPVRPRRLVRNVPRDLVAVCDKALDKDPAGRYPSARELADDLRRWSGWEPVSARPGWTTLRPLRLWAWRNKAWAATAAAVLVALVGGLVYENARAEDRKRQLVELRQQQERERTVLEARDIIRGDHYGGWSLDALARLDLAREVRPGADLRDTAALALTGPDAERTLTKDFPVGALGVAFSPDGKRVVLGGAAARTAKGWVSDPARLWDGTVLGGFGDSPEIGEGPVGFRADGTAVQLILPGPGETGARLWNLDGRRKLADIPCPASKAEAPVAALSADGTLAAVSTAEGTAVWRLPARDEDKPAALPGSKIAATGLVFSPDGRFLAAGAADGRVSVRGVTDGEEVWSLAEGRGAVLALAFGRKFWRGEAEPDGVGRWLLAAGGEGRALGVWDLGGGEPAVRVNSFRGSHHAVHAVAFSPDGTMLVSAGRRCPMVWDVATGRLLFFLGDRQYALRNWMTGIAVSPDGRKVVVSSRAEFGMPGGVDLWELDETRGVRTFRGLAGVAQKTWFSPSGRWVAGLAQDWRVGVWDTRTGRLAFAFDLPRGFSADNAGLAFDPDEREFAFSAGTRVTRWEIGTGRLLKSWAVPAGLNDQLATLPSGNWLLFRGEFGPPERPWPLAGVARELDRQGGIKPAYSVGAVPLVQFQADS